MSLSLVERSGRAVKEEGVVKDFGSRGGDIELLASVNRSKGDLCP